MAEVFILLGGNVGDKSKILGIARNLIGERIGMITKVSSVYATESWGFNSALFWNQVIIVETNLNPFELLAQTKKIELEMGRTKKTVFTNGSASYEDRTIDIDLLFYDNIEINTVELIIPHPKISERKFVLVPLNELAPEKYHPVLERSLHELLESCGDELKVDPID